MNTDVGTPYYMAPEIGYSGYTKSIEIYSLGVVMYEVLTLELPFTAKDSRELH